MRSHSTLSLYWKMVVTPFGRVHCYGCGESMIPCLDVFYSFSFFEHSFPLLPSLIWAPIFTTVLAESVKVQSGVNHILSSGGQGGNQDWLLAEGWVPRILSAQDCGIRRAVAYFGRGQMGTEFVYADPQIICFCSPKVLAITPKSYMKKI